MPIGPSFHIAAGVRRRIALLWRAEQGAVMKPLDLRLNAIVDPERAGGHDLVDLARRLAAGGATLIQLRDKKRDTRPMIEAARAIKAAHAPYAIPFVVNDRIDVVLAAQADGVHIGPDDMAPEDARALLGPDAIIGVSIKSVAAAEALPVGLVNYAGVGGVYATLSKEQENPPIGPQGLSRIATALRRRAPGLPIVGIAGIDAGNAGAVIAAGADGVAVISAVSLVADPAAAARALREAVDDTLATRGM
jgi:thiamine-phosphate pyrophosphorylase